jgi:hypothetical protein
MPAQEPLPLVHIQGAAAHLTTATHSAARRRCNGSGLCCGACGGCRGMAAIGTGWLVPRGRSRVSWVRLLRPPPVFRPPRLPGPWRRPQPEWTGSHTSLKEHLMRLNARPLAVLLFCVTALVGCGSVSLGGTPNASSSTTSSVSGASVASSGQASAGPIGSSNPTSSRPPTAAPSPSIVSTLLTIGSGQTVLRGAGGSFRWTKVQISLATTVVRWLATAGPAACTLSWKLSGQATASGTAAAATGGKSTGKSRISGTSSSDQITVVTACKAWLLTFNSR